jgi:FG-GAP-like repeat
MSCSTSLGRLLCGAAVLIATTTTAQAQIGWLSFHKDDSKLSAPTGLGLTDPEEKDYAWADLDQDGWTDLIVVRKQPFTTQGRRVNVLLMNEGGVLTDRTTQYASASDVAGDNGFKTPTNDRDVTTGDVNGDGWLDVITASTLSPGQPKHISHPRIYINLGVDGGGNWLGLRFENSRYPDFGTFPNFCGVGIGDVTGDGSLDLYFAHYEQSADVDLNDRLLINDGNGFFTDESASRMTANMLASSFGVAAVIEDMNGDGVADIVKDTALGSTGASGPRVVISYNNPGNEGFFNLLQTPYAGAPYHVNVGDLNKDGKPDLVISDDGADRYLLNTGNDGLGRVQWSAAFTYNTDDGFGSNNMITDLDGDGWGDVLIADVDVDISGCGRRLHIFHNQGGAVGGNVTIKEESGAGWKGVTGLKTSDMTGTHDMAVFDLDNDGDMDMVIGRCTSTSVWINEMFDGGADIGTNYCDPAVANSTGQPATIGATGSDVVANNDVTLTTTQMPTNQFGYFITSMSSGFVANPGGSQGNLCLSGTMGRFISQVQNSGALGKISIPVDLNNMPGPVQSQVNPGETWYFTSWYRDNNPGPVSNFANGVSVLFQ